MSSRQSQRTVELHVGGTCGLRCAVCDCRADSFSLEEALGRLRGGGSRLTLRGSPETSDSLTPLLGAARDEGFDEVIVRTNALAFADPGRARALLGSGVHGALVPLFSQRAAVHDRIAGEDGALVQALVGMRSLAMFGAAIDIEIPLLPGRLSRPVEVVELAHRAVPGLRSVRFYMPRQDLPAALAPDDWSVAAPSLAAALERCSELGVQVALRAQDAIPLCALRDYPDLHHHHRFNPRGRVQLSDTRYFDACDGCAARPQCSGVSRPYASAHGEAGLRPWSARPRRMYEQRTTPGRVWTDAQRRAAKSSRLLVVRPTVNCNQDCPFCSANESSQNVWPDPVAMHKQIARAARRGVDFLSISGGEPTLSKHLASFIRVARRAGIPRVEIVSNGVLLDRRERVDRLVDAGLNFAFISLHGHDERLSRLMTQKVGDFARTVSAIRNLIDAGVEVTINHVIGSRNYRYLETFVEFIKVEFGGRARISFAFMTPQFKALMNLHLVPRLSEVEPYLKRALHRALELDQPFVVGSRQGIPPCFLGEFQAWSDVLDRADQAISEDQPQKVRSPSCDACRYGRHCAGVWKPYAEVYGLDELHPVTGGPFDEGELQALRERFRPPPWGVERRFEDLHPLLRDRAAERAGPPTVATPEPPDEAFEPGRTRPLRVLMLGSGQRARRLTAESRAVSGLSIDAVASPHALDGDNSDFGHAPVYDDALEALEATRPEAVIVAAATDAHASLALAAIERGVAVLLEVPATRTDDECIGLIDAQARSGVPVMVAHDLLFAPGIESLWSDVGDVTRVVWKRRVPRTSASAARTWKPEGLSLALYSDLALVGHFARRATEARVLDVSFVGDSTPERLHLRLDFGGVEAEFILEYRGTDESATLSVSRSGQASPQVWHQSGDRQFVGFGSDVAPVPRAATGPARMLDRFRAAATGEVQVPTTLADSLATMRTARAVLMALDAAGAPLRRAAGPRHVASGSLVAEMAVVGGRR